MNVRVESMCQGDGKIYVQVAIERLSPDAIVILEAHLKDGTVIPSHLLPFDPLDGRSGANFAVIVPHLAEREIMLEFSEYRSTDAPLGHAHLTIETNMLSWRTRINSMVRNELINQMFDIEREYYSDRMNTKFIAAVDDQDDIVVKMLVDLPQIDGVDVEVRFLDAHGKERDLPVYPLFEEIKPARRFGDESRINVGFSVRVPREDKDFCVSVYDALDVVAGGFAMFCDETYEPLALRSFHEARGAASDQDYNEWYLLHSATLADLAEQRRLTFAHEPLITLIMPLSNGEAAFVPQAFAALAAQTYNVFEVVVLDRYYGDDEFNALIAGLKGPESLTRVKLDEHASFDEVFVSGLAQAKGDHCALITPDIVLAPEALFEIVRRINEALVRDAPDSASIIYAHHDTMNIDGTLGNLSCKPIYSPDLLLSYNYVGPLVVFETALVRRIQQEQGLVGEALVYDLLFKAYERTMNMERIDQVLYHLQSPPVSGTLADEALVLAREEDFRGGRRVVSNHLKRIGVEATVLSDVREQAYRCNYALPEKEPAVLVIIVNRDKPYLLEACLESLFGKNSYENFEVRIVDDASALPETFECYGRMEGRYSCVKTILNKQRTSYAACVNQVLRAEGIADVAADGGLRSHGEEENEERLYVAELPFERVLLLDSDVEIASDDIIARMVGLSCRDEVGVVGGKLLFSDDTIAQAGMTVGSDAGSVALGVGLPRSASGYLKRIACTNEVSAVSKACQLIKCSVIEEVGGYDERFRLDFSDTDFCLKVIKAGYFVVYDPQVELFHFENTVKDEHLSDARRIRLEQERAYLRFKWPRAFVEGDPFSSALLAAGNAYYQLYL